MTKSYSPEQEERFQSLLKVHLKKQEHELPAEEQVKLLQKKDRNKWWMLAVNIAAILFFGYSFFTGITQLSDTLLYILLVVFMINVGLIFYQKKQLKELVEYLQDKHNILQA